jgi:hypothetical protein
MPQYLLQIPLVEAEHHGQSPGEIQGGKEIVYRAHVYRRAVSDGSASNSLSGRTAFF